VCVCVATACTRVHWVLQPFDMIMRRIDWKRSLCSLCMYESACPACAKHVPCIGALQYQKVWTIEQRQQRPLAHASGRQQFDVFVLCSLTRGSAAKMLWVCAGWAVRFGGTWEQFKVVMGAVASMIPPFVIYLAMVQTIRRKEYIKIRIKQWLKIPYPRARRLREV
jgi:hypothetical protein